jgi:hypothetical protein
MHWLWLLDWWLHHGHHHLLVPHWPLVRPPASFCVNNVCTG